MFEKQLRTDVDEILTNIGIKYDILNFRGMDRDIHKWSTRASYDYYKTTKDYETWIFIKLDKSTDEKDYPKVILTLDDDPSRDIEGIKIINARDWLLGLNR